MQDIIATVAWSCGDEPRECGSPGGWHMANYWIDDTAETGYTLDNYADGDHDEVDEADLPTPDEVVESWRDYAAWVVENGLDPLHNYFIAKDVTTQTRTYTVTLLPSILGPIIHRLRRNHRDAMADLAIVAPLREYLMAVHHGQRWIVAERDANGEPMFRVGSIPSVSDIAASEGKRTRRGAFTTTFTVEVERPDAAVRERAAVIQIAQRAS